MYSNDDERKMYYAGMFQQWEIAFFPHNVFQNYWILFKHCALKSIFPNNKRQYQQVAGNLFLHTAKATIIANYQYLKQ